MRRAMAITWPEGSKRAVEAGQRMLVGPSGFPASVQRSANAAEKAHLLRCLAVVLYTMRPCISNRPVINGGPCLRIVHDMLNGKRSVLNAC